MAGDATEKVVASSAATLTAIAANGRFMEQFLQIVTSDVRGIRHCPLAVICPILDFGRLKVASALTS